MQHPTRRRRRAKNISALLRAALTSADAGDVIQVEGENEPPDSNSLWSVLRPWFPTKQAVWKRPLRTSCFSESWKGSVAEIAFRNEPCTGQDLHCHWPLRKERYAQ